MGKIKVHISCGVNLVAADFGGTSDPYVKLSTSKDCSKTKFIKKTLNPVWDETFTLYVSGPGDRLSLRVFDHDTLTKDDAIGETVLDLMDLVQGQETKVKAKLCRVKHGEIHYSVTAMDFGRPPAQTTVAVLSPPPPTIVQSPGYIVQTPGTIVHTPGTIVSSPPQPVYASNPPPQQAVYTTQQTTYTTQTTGSFYGGGPAPQQTGSFYGTSPAPAPQAYPPQQSGYPPQQGYPPPQQSGSFYGSTQAPQAYQQSAYAQQGYPPQAYPPQQSGYPPQQAHPSQHSGSFTSLQQTGSYYGTTPAPAPQAYPPQQPGYAPQQAYGSQPPPYPSQPAPQAYQQSGYAQQGYPPQAYPPQQSGYGWQ